MPDTGAEDGSSAGWLVAPLDPSVDVVVKLLVVRTGPRSPLLVALDIPFLCGVPSWLWPLCIAGLPHGSASGKSIESFRIVRGLGGDTSEEAGGVEGR